MNVSEIFELIGALIILLGSIISVISAIGIIRFRDIYQELMPPQKQQHSPYLLLLSVRLFTYGLVEGYISIRLMLGIVFVFMTAPVSGHLVLRAAYRAKVKMADETAEDELKPILFKEKKSRG